MADRIDQLFGDLQSRGFAKDKTLKEFRDYMLAPGDQGYQNRKTFFEDFKSQGLTDLETYEDFKKLIGLHAEKPQPRQQEEPVTQPDANESLMNDVQNTLSENQRVLNRMDNQQQRAGLDTGTRVQLGGDGYRLGENRKVTKGQQRFDLGTGKMQQTYITPQGNEYGSREQADLEQNTVDIAERSQTLPGQLEDANLERKRLQAQIDELEAKQNAAIQENNGFVYHDKNIFTDEDAEQLQALKAAYRTNEERATALEAERDDAGFWQGFIDAAKNPSTFTFGLTDMFTASSLSKIKNKIDAAKGKGVEPELTPAEQALLENTFNKNMVDQQYGDNRGFLYRAGGISMQALPFIGEFYMTGGFSAFTQAGANAGTKMAEKMALEGFKKTLLRNTGVVAGDIAAGWAMANTTGFMRTYADYKQRRMGDVTINPEGQYDFGHYDENDNFIRGGKGAAQSFYEAQVAQTLEYYTEKLGEHLQLGKWIAKGAEKLGLSKLSKAINYLSSNSWLERGGIQDYPSEVVEEQANLILNAALVGDNKFSDLVDGKTQADIWGGMLFSIGMMQAPRLAYTGTQAAGYYAFKKNVDMASNSAAITFGADNWQMIKEQIDNCDNEHLPELLSSIVNGDMNPMQKTATMNYAGNLLKMRGYNMGMMAGAKDLEQQSTPEAAVEQTINQSYQQGHMAEDADEKKAIYDEAAAAGTSLSQYGKEFAKMVQQSQDPVATMNDLMNKRDIYSDEQIAAAADYYQKQARAMGMLDASDDAIDIRIENSNAEVRSQTHQETGQVITARFNDDIDYYIIGGEVGTDEQGFPTIIGTGGAVVVQDMYGDVSVKSPQEVSMILNIDNAEDLIQWNETVLRQQLEQQADDDITYGSPANETYNIEDEVVLLDGQGGTVQGVVGMMPNSADGVFVIYTNDGKALQLTADDLNRRIVNHNGADVQRATPPAAAATGAGAVEGQQNAQQQTKGAEAGGEAGSQQTSGDEPPASALSRIPVRMDDKGQPMTTKKGRPILDWHKASVEDAAAALVETTDGDKLMARDTASSLVREAQDKLEKIRKQKPKGEDPIEMAESRVAIKRQEQEQQAIIKQWQDVGQTIQKQMREEEQRRIAEREAAKSEEQRQREAEEARIRKEQQDEADRKKIREQIEKDKADRTKEYEPLVKARKELKDDADAMDILNDTEPSSLEEWVSSLLNPHSFLWLDASDSERGLQTELGLKRADMQRFMTLFGNKENGAKPFGKAVLDIYEALPEGMKNMYTDEDVARVVRDMFQSMENSAQMMHLTEYNRIEQARQLAQENERRAAEAEMDAWAEAYHLTPEERETFEDYLQQAPSEPEQEIINNIIADEQFRESHRSSDAMDQQPVSGTAVSGIEGGESQVQQTGETATVGNHEEGSAAETEAPAGQPSAADNNVPGAAQRVDRESLRVLFDQIGADPVLADRISDYDVEQLTAMVEDWEVYNDDYGYIIEKNKKALQSKDKKVRDAAQKEVDEAQQKANEAFTPIEEYVEGLNVKYSIESEEPFEGAIPTPKIDSPRFKAIRQKLIDTYSAYLDRQLEADRRELLEATKAIRDYVDEGLDAGELTPDIEDLAELYDGNDPQILADEYIVRVLWDRYLDDDSDQEYITTGLKPNMRFDNKFVGKFKANDCGVCINPNVIEEHKEKNNVNIGYSIKTAQTDKGWVGGVSAGTSSAGMGIPVTAGSNGIYFDTEKECQEYWSKVALDYLAAFAKNDKKIGKYIASLQKLVKPSEQLKPTDQRDAIRPESAELGVKEANARQAAERAASPIVKKIQDAVAAHTSKYNTLAPVEIVDIDSDEALSEAYKGITGEELTADQLPKARQELKDSKHAWAFGVKSKKIYIFAQKIDLADTELALFHESLHRGLQQYYGDNLVEVAEAFWDTTSPTNPAATEKHKKDIAEAYKDKPEDIKEEYLVNVLSYHMTKGSAGRILSRLSEEHQEIVNNILHNIGYDTAEETRQRNPEEAQRLGAVQEEPRPDREDGRGRVDSSIQGLDGMTEEEVLDSLKYDINDILQDNDLSETVTIKGMSLNGSRLRGDAKEDSDLDVVVEYEGDISEDGLFNILNGEGLKINGITIDFNPITKGKSGTLEQFMERSRKYDEEKKLGKTSSAKEIAAEEAKVDTNPTEAQKEAGNYQKGHINIDGFDITIENPKGSVRSGVDANGKPWSVTMNNTYGYIRGTEGVDGDHIDVFLSDNPASGKVWVIDQVKPDGSFDEHKVMYGFVNAMDATNAYLSNYSEGWQGLDAISGISREEFKKWVESSHRKTKPFREYAMAKSAEKPAGPAVDTAETVTKRKERWQSKKGEKPAAKKEHKYLISDEKMEELRQRLLEKLHNVNAGIDPELMLLGAMYATAKIERGITKFADYVQEMLNSLDDSIRPYLKSFYNAIRDMPEAQEYAADMDDYDTVAKFDVYNFDKKQAPNPIVKAEQVTKERKIRNQAKKIQAEQPDLFAGSLFDDTVEEATEKAKKADKPIVQIGDTFTNFLNAKPDGTAVEITDIKETENGRDYIYKDIENDKTHTISERDLSAAIKTREWKRNKSAQPQAKQEEAKTQERPLMLRPATDADLDNSMAEFYHDGKRVWIMLVTRKGEQVSATKFSEPTVESVVLTNGKSVKYSELQVRDDKNGKPAGETSQPATTPKTSWWSDPNRPKDLNPKDYKTYTTNEAKDYFAKYVGPVNEKGKHFPDFTKWAHPNLAYITAAAWDGAVIPLKKLQAIHEIKEADDRIKSVSGSLVLTDEEMLQHANHLLDAEHGSAVFVNGKKDKGNYSGPVRQERKALIVIGKPAGGKSSVFADRLSYDFGARIVDSDTVKPWLEGFDDGYGAGYVHDASAHVADMALDMAAERGDNMIIPRIGGESVVTKLAIPRLIEKGYDVQLYFNDVSEQTSIMRAASRFAEEGRYLSLDYLTTINDKDYKTFINFAEKKLGDYYGEKRNAERPADGSESTPSSVLADGGSNGQGTQPSRSGESGSVSQLANEGGQLRLEPSSTQGNKQVADGTRIFSYAEWKSNDVAFGEAPKEIWNSKSGKPMPTNDNNNEGEQKVSREPLPVGEGVGQASGAAQRTGEERSPEQNRAERSGSEHSVEKPAKPKQAPKNNNKRNNHGERGKDYAPTSPKARFNANVEAIKLMRQLIDDNVEAPTAEQMSVLRQYSGWGGLGTYFNDESSAENKQLREILTDEEYNDAVMSINSAYYTPAMVIDTLWDIAKAMGFKGGNILEGSAGIGNIIGQMPQDISRQSNIEAVEIDSISGNILKLLYPDAKVHIQGFQDTVIRNGSVDLAITNVPFVTGLHVIDKADKDLSKRFVNIHDFCIAKNIRKLSEGGLGIFITSSGTLDKSNDLRAWITDDGQADVIGAFRMNNETFGGTKVTSDIIVVRKRVDNQKSTLAIDVSKSLPVRVETYSDKYGNEHQATMVINEYFEENPDMMAGEMAFGFEKEDSYRPGSYGLFPAEDKDQPKMLAGFVKYLKKRVEMAKDIEGMFDTIRKKSKEKNAEPNQLTAVKEGRMLIDDKGRICISRLGEAIPLDVNDEKVKGQTKQQCFEDYQAVQKAVDDVLQQQLNDPDDAALEPKLDALNKAFDLFVKRYGTLHKNKSIAFLRNDIDFPSFLALENYSETKDIKGKVTVNTSKTPLFRQRVLGFKTEPQPKTVKDAVISSIFRTNGIDLEWIADKLSAVAAPPNGDHWTADDVRKGILVSRLGFENPSTGQLEVRYKYLSGNVREKLAIAEQYNSTGDTAGRYAANIEELKKVIPMDIPSHLIDFSLGSSWIPVQLYKDYLKENYDIDNVTINHIGGTWTLDPNYFRNEKNKAAGVYSEMFREVTYGHELVAAALNNRPVKVEKKTKEETVVDQAATQACAVRVDEIKDEFRQWMKKKMQDDPELAKQIEKIYNDKFNALVPLEIGDEFLPEHFEDSNVNISLYGHQKRGVLRGVTAPTMLAHEVGTGKSFTLITTAMEMRRLGTAKKPMIVVQNATVAQMTADAKLLYPNAKVLSLSEKDRVAEGRRAFYAKIKYNDWDIIIVPQSTFERIPDSPERDFQFIQEKIDEKKHVIMAAEAAKVNSREVSRLKRELDKMEQELGDKKLANDPVNIEFKKKKDAKREAASLDKAETRAKEQLDRAVDDVQYFDDMGVDALLVDEAHEYKHLGFQTSIGPGIKGIDPSYSKKCAGLYNKTRSVFEKAGWKNVVFATGTPISNTAAEIWTFMKYLMPADVMRDNDIYYFDDFVHNFGAISQMLEFSTSGKFKENTRFAAYLNKPELIRIWSQVADTVLTKEVGAVNEKIPEQEGGKDQDYFLPQSPSLVRIMAAVRAELERFENMSGNEKKLNSSIPLTMYGIAKRAAIDPRLVDAEAPDEPMSKTNAAVKEIVKDLKVTKDYKGTVAVFCDNQNRMSSNAAGKKKVVEFNIYDDMKAKLIKAGVPEKQIAIVKSGMSITAKQKIFDAVNSGDIRVVLGSTQTLGTGVNIQERLHLLIHMDAPDRPMDYTQRNGRIKRQGNLHKVWGKTIKIIRFGVEDSLDVTAYQRLKTKSGFIDSIMDGKGSLLNNQVDRTVEEEEEGLFDNPVAVLSGSQFALKKNQAERELRKYQGKKAQWEADQVYIHDNISRNTRDIERYESEIIPREESFLKNVRSHFPDGVVKTVGVNGIQVDMTSADASKKLSDAIKEKINDLVNAIVKSMREDRNKPDAYLNYTVSLNGVAVQFRIIITREEQYDYERRTVRSIIHKNVSYRIPDLRLDSQRDCSSVKDGLEEIMQGVITGNESQGYLDNMHAEVERLKNEISQMKQREGKPFQFEKELQEARQRVEEYTEQMKQEMAEKEAKYAAQQKEAEADGKGFDLHKAEDNTEDEEEVLAREEGAWDDDAPIFISNARYAVESIRQEKATTEQWLAMIQKNGGIKAGEDKWLGLSDWLKEQKGSVTKQEVLDYIRQNQIQVEEVEYGQSEKAPKVIQDKFDEYFKDELMQLGSLRGDAAENAWRRMREDYGDDFDIAFWMNEDNGNYEVLINNAEAAETLVDLPVRPINHTRLGYTTNGLENKREIALTVPTIKPWEKGDQIHFGDAGGGRAVAWVRFGDTTIYDDDNAKLKEANAIMADNDKWYAQHPEFAKYGVDKDGTLKKESEERKERQRAAFAEAYNVPQNKKVLVIDEIQSNRHQEGRKKGYRKEAPSDAPALLKLQAAEKALDDYHILLAKKYGRIDISYGLTEEEDKTWKKLFREAFDAQVEFNKYAEENHLGNFSDSNIPGAPFENNWHELAMKRMLRYAAENGYDKIAWTTGAQQAERYKIGTIIDSIGRTRTFEDGQTRYDLYPKNGNGSISLFVKDGKVVDSVYDDLVGKNLAEIVGKELSIQMAMMKDEDTLDSRSFTVGNEGMKGFYDNMLVRYMDKYGKKWGVHVQKIELPKLNGTARHMWSIDVTPEMKESVMHGQLLFRQTEQFEDGQSFPIHTSYAYGNDVTSRTGTYSVDLMPDVYSSEDQMLDAVRRQYPSYYAHIEDGQLVMDSWDGIMGDARLARTMKQQKSHKSFIERKTRNAVNAVNEMAQRMGLDVEVLTTTEGLTGEKARYKGWFNPKTGKIVLVLPNNSNQYDLINTLLHEGVAHYGLRKMFGEHFGTFLDNVYENVSPEIKARIDAAMKRNGWSRHEATEEYLARLAERTDFDNAQEKGWWQKIKDFFFRMLGMKGFNTELTDNELRYILWRSYDNLLHPDSRRNIFDKAREVMMESRLKVGRQAEYLRPTAEQQVAIAAEPSPSEGVIFGRTDYASDEINAIVDKAMDDGTYMLAPNGKPSNLDELQWAQVRTKAFKEWFGDWENDPENASKVVDENGEPKVMYHKTNLDVVNKGVPFYTFYEDSHFGTKGQANDRVRSNDTGVKIYEVFLNIRNPQRRADADQDYLEDKDMTMSEFWEQSAERAKSQGYDGIVYLNEYEDKEHPADSWIAFNPNQVKSATENDGSFSSEDDDIRYSIRTKEAPKKTGIGYKVFYLHNRNLYPPMVANPNGEGTPAGQWLDADAAPVIGAGKTGRQKVKAGGKGTQGGSGQLAYRPGWHLGTIPYALQFNRGEKVDNPLGITNKKGETIQVGKYFPNDFVWAEVEYAADKDYQKEAESYGYNEAGNYQPSLAGLPKIPVDGSYMYRTNPNPATDPWIITGAMRVKRLLTRAEVDELVRQAGREPQLIQDGDTVTDELINDLNDEIKATREADDMGLLARDDSAWDDNAKDFYEKAVAQDGVKFKESWQDSMVSLKLLQNAIAHETGKVATGAEDAYRYENRMHGKAKNMTEQYDYRFYRPMMKAFNDFCKQRGYDMQHGLDYLISKSGLERNVYYAMQHAIKEKITEEVKKQREKLEKDYAKGRLPEADYKDRKAALDDMERHGADDVIAELKDKFVWKKAKEEYNNGNIGYTEYLRRLETIIRHNVPKYDEYAYDYSGLTETFAKERYDDAQDIKKEAQRAIDPRVKRALWKRYDQAMKDAYQIARQEAEDAVFSGEPAGDASAKKLWEKINAATEETLRTSYESSMMERKTYDKVRSMFDYYIPLRGWEKDKAADVYTYMGKDNVFSPAVKKTWGRTSKAENPLAYIGNIAVSTILVGQRNIMKQHFLNYVMNNPTNLVSISESWYENIGTADDPLWILRSADTAGKSGDEITQIVNDFNEEMKQKQREGKAMPITGRLRLDVHATKGQKAEHVIEVQRAGHTYQIYINGNPMAAQALNGTAARAVSRISQTYIGQKVTNINRNMAAFFTSKNPAFVISNLSRDLNMAGASVAINEGGEYNARFIANVAKVLRPRMGESAKWVPASKQPTGMMPSLLRKWKKGTLNMADETERLFKEFMDEGGETGFVNMLSVDSFKEKMNKEIAEMNGSSLFGSKGAKETNIHKGLRLLGDTFEFYNRCAEDATRFIVYMTSRQMGKTLEESIADAKDVTLNFNRKGTGAMGNAEIRDLFIFVNPAIQALANMYRMLRGKPLKFGAVTLGFVTVGALIPIINQWFLQMWGDDDDKDAYWNLPPWVRKNNLVFWIPFTKNFVTLPLAQEFRVFYGTGEMLSSMVMDHPVDKWGLELFSSVSDLVPINPTGNGGNLLVDFAPTMVQPLMQLNENVDFTGRPIWRDNQGNKFAPMYTKAYVSTPEWMVKLSEGINTVTGGNEGKKGALEKYVWGGEYLNNPAVWNHLLQGYFGGMYNTIAKTVDVVGTVGQGELPKIYQTPIVNRFINRPFERDNAGALGEDYYGLLQDRDALRYELKVWKKKAADGDADAQAHVEEIESSKDWQRAEVITHYERIMKDLKAGERAATDKDEKQDIKRSIPLYKQMLTEELAAIDNGKDPLEAATEQFANAKTLAEKKALKLRIERLMNASKKASESSKDVEKALSYTSDGDENTTGADRYLELATADMIKDDARIKAAKAKIKAYTDHYKQLMDDGKTQEAAQYRADNQKWFVASTNINSHQRAIAENRKLLLGKSGDSTIMRIINIHRNAMLKTIGTLE